MIGRILGNRYQIVERLGGGGMAQVYKAWDKVLERSVTVKILRESLTSDQEFVRRFRREAQAIASLSHPNIVNVYDVGREDDTDYIVMEFIDGPTLKEVIRSRAPLSPEETVDLAKQICDALEHAHQQGIIHRDIKPHNILLTRDGRVKVTDFGIARSVSQSTMTMDRSIVGSVHYLSPEQARGVPVDEKSDIYALGVVMYEMLSGQVPFQGETLIAVALQQIQQAPPALSRMNARVPASLEEVVFRALEKDPGRRYPNAKSLKQDLNNVFFGRIVGRLPLVDDDSPTVRIDGGITVESKESHPGQEKQAMNLASKLSSKRNVVLWLVSLLAVALAGFGAAYWWWQSYMSVPEVMLPNVAGKHYIEASAAIQRSGLTNVQVTTAYHPNVSKDIVVTQEPDGDRMVKKTREVRLTVSLGPKLSRVPVVTNMPQREAMIKLQEADFKYETVEEFDEKIAAGTVISQTPQGNTEQSAGTVINLKVSKGPEQKKTMVPVIGLKVQEAQAKLEPLGISIKLVAQEDSVFPVGTVMSQDPPPNTPIKPGDTATLVYSTAPANKPVPSPVTKTAVISIPIPNDGKEHTVRITVQDAKGSQQPYIGKHRGGETVSREIQYTGKAVIQAFVDSSRVFSREVD